MSADPDRAKVTKLRRDGPVAVDLVILARGGDEHAWDALVERYAPLIWSICRRYRLNPADAGDVGQSVWLQMLNHLDAIRDPAALAGWLVTTTGRECSRILRAARQLLAAGSLPDAPAVLDPQVTPEHELLVFERHAVLRQALTDLPACCQQLIALLIEDPPVPYAQISAKLGIPVGSIGPTRARCLSRLRRHPAIAALINADSEPHGTSYTATNLAAMTDQRDTGCYGICPYQRQEHR
jgi:RNA polymerase sigma factor (sigma-70 family)